MTSETQKFTTLEEAASAAVEKADSDPDRAYLILRQYLRQNPARGMDLLQSHIEAAIREAADDTDPKVVRIRPSKNK